MPGTGATTLKVESAKRGVVLRRSSFSLTLQKKKKKTSWVLVAARGEERPDTKVVATTVEEKGEFS